MRIPFLSKPDPNLHLKLPNVVPTAAAVLYQAKTADEAAADSAFVAQAGLEWLEHRGVSGRVREAIQKYYQLPLFGVRIDSRETTAAGEWPPIQPMKLDEAAERVAAAATHGAILVANDIRESPRVGLWAANAAALGLAWKTGGIALAFPLPVPLRTGEGEFFPRNGQIAVAQHTFVPHSIGSGGLGYMTTVGMEQFGLPNLQLKEVSPSLFSPMLEVLMGIAQQLVTRSMAVPTAPRGNDSPQEFTLGSQLLIQTSDVAAAFGKPERAVLPNAKQRARVRLELQRAGGPNSEMMLTVLPLQESRARASVNVWLSELIGDLFGTEDTVRTAQVGDAAVAAAHARATTEFPYYRDRFAAGLAPGERLLVKYGFPVSGADTEHEYMWITVTSIRAGALHGTLSNNPQHRLDLRSGQNVSVPVADVYDFLFTDTSGRSLGNYTGKAIMGVPMDAEM